MMVVSPPFHCHIWRNRVYAFESTGSCSSASLHVCPPSVLTSTRVIRPRPVHATPEISCHPGSSAFGYAGVVMMDLASMTKLNCRATPEISGSVYFDVSSFDMFGWSMSLMRRSHLMDVLPSKPGSSSRAGYPVDGRSASPLNAYATIASSNTFSMGMLRDTFAASPPSANNHLAERLTPASWRMAPSGTPVHSPLLHMPSTCCGVISALGSR